jgi:flavin-dependent thymidylate synthase
MKVLLAGYNIDSSVIDELKKNSPSLQNVTPETMSAAYARISRDPRSVDALRAVARTEVERARRSNKNIIFKMGHHSVAEHAVFNFDIIGLSRLAIEEIEKFRLCSYTEKSQRYVKLEDDFILPEEIKKAGRQKIFLEVIKTQNALYHELYKKLKPYFFESFPALAANSKKHAILNGWAKEDARYCVSLATLGQLGLTANARNLEFLIRRFASKELAEIKALNQKIYVLAKAVAPSIILFTEANEYDAKTYKNLVKKTELLPFVGRPKKRKENIGGRKDRECVQLVDHTADGDTRLVAALLHTSSPHSYKDCLLQAKALEEGQKKDMCKTAFQHMEFFDAVLREFEYVDLTFDLVISATCFAQLKRHRMATLTAQPYDLDLGVTLPQSIEDIGTQQKFKGIIDQTEECYRKLKESLTTGAEYILTNAHRRRVLIRVNARELYHMARLREDQTAQWDIRQIVSEMSQKAKKVMPLTFSLLGAKDSYPELYKELFGKFPKLMPTKIGSVL